MKELIGTLARRPVMVIMAICALCIAAGFSLSVLPLQRLPDLSIPRVTVETAYPGMAADDIRTLVTIPVEDALSPVKKLQRIRSVSRDGSSLVSLDFKWGSDIMTACALVREAIDSVYPSLPEGACKPLVTPDDNGSEPCAIVVVHSTCGDKNFARNLAEYELRVRLRRIDGVGAVILSGGETGEERLKIDPQRLAARKISPSQLVRLAAGETGDVPAGNVREGDRELVVVSSGRPETPQELARMLIPLGAGAFRLEDSGELSMEPGRRKSIFMANGKDVAALEIYQRPGADPVKLSREIRQTLGEAVPLFSRDAEIFLVKDSAKSLVSGIRSLGISAALGAAAVIAALLVFLRQLKYSLLAALSIPVSAAAGFCVLALAGKSLNGMSLGGLALGIGLVSDTSVITLDLLHRSFAKFAAAPSAKDIGECVSSIAASSMASTITTAIVFVPVIFLPGILGSLFGDTAIALVSSITAGWLYAQFILPSLFKFSFKSGAGETANTNQQLENKYRALLARVLKSPQKIYLTAIAASLIGALLLLIKPAVFFSPDEADEVCVSLVFPHGTVLENIADLGCEVSHKLALLPWVTNVYGKAGAEDEDVSRRAAIDYRREELLLHCTLGKKIAPNKALLEIEKTLVAFQSDFQVSTYLPKNKTEALLGLSSAWSFAVRGNDRREVAARAADVTGRLKNLAAHVSVLERPQGLRPELRLYPNREAIAYLGLSGAEIAETIYTLNEGVVAARLELEGKPIDVRIMGKPDSSGRSMEAQLENITLLSKDGAPVYLGSLGRVEKRDAQAVLARMDRSDVIYLDIVSAQGTTALRSSIKEISKKCSWFSLVDENVFNKYRVSLLINICLVLVLLYMTMGAQFESFFLPLILMLCIPFSLAGAGPAILAFGAQLDSGAVLGLITLFGLVVNNGLILFEISDERIGLGCSPAVAVYGGSASRLRPVLITTATTVFALVPFALSPLGNSQKSMAAAMMGGILASTLLSLFALPPVLVRFFSWREKR